MHKKNLFLRVLYDFANSFVFITFLLYFSQRIVIDGGLGDFRYNALFALASVLLLLSSPTLGAFTDRVGGNKRFLVFATLGTAVCYGGATIGAYSGWPIWLIALLFLLGQYFYQLSFTFHNALIVDVADDHHLARASGIGQFANSFGQLAGLALALLFSASRLAPLLPSIAVFVVLAIPMLVYFSESRKQAMSFVRAEYFNDTLRMGKKMRVFFFTSLATPLLVAFFFFQDALVTLTNNYSIYLERVFAIPDTTKNIIMMVILMMTALGGLAFGYIGDKIGTRTSMIYILLSRVVLLPILGVVTSIPYLVVFSGFLGFFMGGIWTITRAYLTQTLHRSELGYGFSFYTLFERFATFLGPLTRGGAIAILGTSARSYRITMVSMTVYVIIGLLIFLYWRRHTQHNRKEN